MHRPIRWPVIALIALCLAGAAPLAAADVQLSVVQFPEGKGIDLKMAASPRVAPAGAEAEVKYKDGQAAVEVDAKKLPPAILFGGDVTSYVVWAVARDGNAENLGELIIRDTSGSGKYRTGQKEFALLVTAEPYALVLKPSELVCFTSVAPPPNKVTSTPITYSGLAAAPRVDNLQIGNMRYTGQEPIEIVQAQHVLDQARAMGAEKYAPDSIREAGVTLAQATNSFKAGNDKVGVDYARRSLSTSSTAIRDTQKKLAERGGRRRGGQARRRDAGPRAAEGRRPGPGCRIASSRPSPLARRPWPPARPPWPPSSSSIRLVSRPPRRSSR